MSADIRGWVETNFPGGKWTKPDEYLVHSPLREEKTASFFVNVEKKCFKDWGGDSGRLTDLAERLGIEPPPWDGQPAKVEPTVDVGKTSATDAIRHRWNEASGATEHAYLARKGLEMPHGLKVDGKGNLLVPSRNFAGQLIGIQEISPDGSKRFMKNSHMGTFVLGDLAEAGHVLVVEGLGTGAALHQALGQPVAVAFSASRVPAIVRELRGRTAATIIAATDADLAGRRAAADSGVEAFVPPGDGGRDWCDVLGEEGAEAIVEAWQSRPVAAKEKSRGFRLVHFGELEAKEPQWLVEGLLEQDSLASVFGESGSGKSFFTLDMAFSIAAGVPFHGRSVEPGPVVYLAGEGFSGLARRRAAWEKHNGISLRGAPIFVSNQAPALLDGASAAQVAEAVDEVAAQVGPPRLVVVDTLARSFAGGDENSSADMGCYIAVLDDLKARYPGSSILIVHHSGHGDKTRSRGSSAFRGAIDSEMLVEGVPGKALTVKSTKTKDGPAFDDLHFELRDVEIEPDVTSAVLVEAEGPAKEEVRLSQAEREALEAFRTAAQESGELDGLKGFAGLHISKWREVAYRQSTEDDAKRKEQRFRRARNSLTQKKILTVQSDIYLPVDEIEILSIVEAIKRRRREDLHSPSSTFIEGFEGPALPVRYLHSPSSPLRGEGMKVPEGDGFEGEVALLRRTEGTGQEDELFLRGDLEPPERPADGSDQQMEKPIDLAAWLEAQSDEVRADHSARLARLRKAKITTANELALLRTWEAVVGEASR